MAVLIKNCISQNRLIVNYLIIDVVFHPNHAKMDVLFLPGFEYFISYCFNSVEGL